MMIIMPVEEKDGKDSRICPHFGRAPYWAIYDSVQKELDFSERQEEHSGGGCRKVEEVLKYEPDVVFVQGLGVKAKTVLDEKGVAVKTGNLATVSEVIENISKTEDFGDVCEGEHEH